MIVPDLVHLLLHGFTVLKKVIESIAELWNFRLLVGRIPA